VRPAASTATIAQRLREARRTAGLTQEAAAGRLGVARTTIVAVEKGERQVRPEELVAFAALYRAEVSDLVRSGAVVQTVTLQLRGRIDAAGEALLEAECRSLAEDYLHLESLRGAPLPLKLPPEVTPTGDAGRSARLAAEDERRRLGLGLEPVWSMRMLLEERLGVRVFQFSLPAASGVAAVYFFEESAGPVVCINGDQRWRRRRLSAAHEFGHVIGSRQTPHVLGTEAEGGGRRSQAEAFADAFQRHFLMPGGALERFVVARRQERGGLFKPSDVVELSDLYGVSFEAMSLALEEDSLTKPGSTAYLLAKGYEANYGPHVESRFAADADPRPVSPRFRRLAATTFQERQLSEGALARLLRVDRLTARRVVRELAEEEGAGESSPAVRKPEDTP
jgi:Zn-dependent peptidase ImmA (M78 family)/DNA-binding XRE family transcriptional regulator